MQGIVVAVRWLFVIRLGECIRFDIGINHSLNNDNKEVAHVENAAKFS